MIKLSKVVIAASILSLTLTGFAFAQVDGETKLAAADCDIKPKVEAYNIDYGTFFASDVQIGVKVNAGTKGDNTTGAGTDRDPDNGASDYYVYVDNECPDENFTSVTVQTDAMVEDGTLATQPTDIPANAQRLSAATDGTVYLFGGTPANPAVTSAVYADEYTLDVSTSVLDHDDTENGLGGQYGALLAHEIVIPNNQVPATYIGNFTVTCNGCL
jgi:hypothetical protein